ncbi:MAG: response regulator transcription factor [Bdellovibrionales bacterium]|nr:response regulator transcription factor [Bdellovibrionales bacterium]
MAKILLIEDDPVLAKSLFFYLRSENHEAHWVQTLTEGRSRMSREPFELLLVDIHLPDGNGTEFCAQLRMQGLKTPVIILTAVDTADSAVNSLRSGANDYVRKPYSIAELLMRIQIQVHGVRAEAPEIRHFRGLEVDFTRGLLRYRKSELSLSQTKLKILDFLISHNGQIVSRESLLQHLNKDSVVHDRTVDSHISQLRRALREKGMERVQISSIYGSGYKIEIA